MAIAICLEHTVQLAVDWSSHASLIMGNTMGLIHEGTPSPQAAWIQLQDSK